MAGNVTHTVKEPATCTSVGTTTYTVTAVFDGREFTESKDVQDIPALEPEIVVKETEGAITYTNTVTENQITQVTKIFNTAKTDGGAVEVSVPTAVTGSPVTISFDSDAVRSIGGNDVTITANITEDGTEVAGSELVIEVTLDGATFSGGKAKVAVPLSGSVPNGKTVKVYFIDGDRKVDMNAYLEDGNVVFETNHFSTYAVFFEDTPSEDGGSFPIAFVAMGAVAVLAVAGAAVFLVRRH